MRHTNIPAAYLFLEKDGKVLLLRRFQTGYNDEKYSMIAGHVDPGESFTECIVREAMEEAGIVIHPENLEVVHMLHRDSHESEEHERIDVFFTAKIWEGEIRNMESHKCDDLSWFCWDALPNEMIPYIKHTLESIREGKVYSEYGWGKDTI